MPTTFAEDQQALADLAAAHTTKLSSDKSVGKIAFAGSHWPNNVGDGKVAYADANYGMDEARQMVFRGIQVAKAALRGDEKAVELMTTWFGDRPTAGDDWWLGVDYILTKLNIALLRDIQVFYRNRSTKGLANDYPAGTGVIKERDVQGYAETMAGDDNLVIGLCEDFFSKGKFRTRTIALTGFDSVGGVLVHEMSHNLASTQDHEDSNGDDVYGVDSCKQFAIDDPSKAWYNADNIEYFCEEASYGPAKVKTAIVTGAATTVKSKVDQFNP